MDDRIEQFTDISSTGEQRKLYPVTCSSAILISETDKDGNVVVKTKTLETLLNQLISKINSLERKVSGGVTTENGLTFFVDDDGILNVEYDNGDGE